LERLRLLFLLLDLLELLELELLRRCSLPRLSSLRSRDPDFLGLGLLDSEGI
jgi:hypothetical protein